MKKIILLLILCSSSIIYSCASTQNIPPKQIELTDAERNISIVYTSYNDQTFCKTCKLLAVVNGTELVIRRIAVEKGGNTAMIVTTLTGHIQHDLAPHNPDRPYWTTTSDQPFQNTVAFIYLCPEKQSGN